jgi:segregation and condensation protein B
VSNERRDSLVEQAAAWVPPWLRKRPAETSEDDRSAPIPRQAAEAETATAAEPAQDQPILDEPRAVEAETAERGAQAPERGAAALEAAEPTVVAPTAPEPGIPDEEAQAERRLALVDDAELRAALEAILLVVDEPVSEIVLAQVLEQPTERIAATLSQLAQSYTDAGHGFDLRRAAGGWRLYTRPEYAPYVERFVLDGQSVRLTQAALETLAIIAYKQPVTRSQISAVRGVNCDGVVRTLLSRGLIETCGTEPETGAHLYRTTSLFLEKLGLDSLDQLPPLAPLLPENLEEIPDEPR